MRAIGQWITAKRSVVGVLGLALIVGSCSSSPERPPRTVDDICAIFEERPEWRDAVLDSARRWGAPVEVQMAIMWHESRFRAEARPPKRYTLGVIPAGRLSSAYGYPQAVDGTWEWYREETGNGGAVRHDFEDAADFVGWYMAKTAELNSVPMFDAFRHYLNYHEGHTGFRRGDWRGSQALQRVATGVADRAVRYRGQLRRCGGEYAGLKRAGGA